MIKKTKISVIGAGMVGSTTTFSLALSNFSLEIALIDIDEKKAMGDAIDIMHGSAFLPSSEIYAGNYTDCRDSDIIIITAGAKQKHGESRINLLKRNYGMFKQIIGEIVKNCTHQPTIIVVSNPVDILAYLSYELSGFPRNKVFGSGTLLDSSRFKYLIGKHINIEPKSLHAYIIGEHGDSEVAAWSKTSIAGMRFDEYCKKHADFNEEMIEKIANEVRDAAYKVIEMKGSTYYAIALSARRIVECILGDERAILPVSVALEGEYGIRGIAISLPAVIGKNGIEDILQIEYSENEIAKLHKSAEGLKKSYHELKNTDGGL
ncbi:MAG: L-lactate dehydrogenase [Treponema sp.]|nr:L-lactate dehydrogenase [Treponema sp.]